MSTTAFDVSSSTQRKEFSLPGWTREPLLHFVILGALLFAVDHFVVASKDDPHTIVMDASVDEEATRLFKGSQGRAPDADELRALRQTWLDNEVLYREGLALEVDKGDPAIRDRVIFKALSMIDANVSVPHADDKTLRAWFDSHRNKYDEPAIYDFREAVLTGDTSESAVRTFVDQLNTGAGGEVQAGLRVYKGRPLSNLTQSFGPDFAKALEEIPAGQWRAVHARDGWHAISFESSTPAKPAKFEALRGVVLHDWIDATAAEQRTSAVRALQKKYTVKYGTAAK
jgi:PPIC-type PPIASE domain